MSISECHIQKKSFIQWTSISFLQIIIIFFVRLNHERQRQSWLENEVKVLQQRVQKSDEVVAAANSLGEQIAAKNQVFLLIISSIIQKNVLFKSSLLWTEVFLSRCDVIGSLLKLSWSNYVGKPAVRINWKKNILNEMANKFILSTNFFLFF